MAKKVEAEGQELIIRADNGDIAIIPKNMASKVSALIESGDQESINKVVSSLPTEKNYAEDGTYIVNPEGGDDVVEVQQSAEDLSKIPAGSYLNKEGNGIVDAVNDTSGASTAEQEAEMQRQARITNDKQVAESADQLDSFLTNLDGVDFTKNIERFIDPSTDPNTVYGSQGQLDKSKMPPQIAAAYMNKYRENSAQALAIQKYQQALKDAGGDLYDNKVDSVMGDRSALVYKDWTPLKKFQDLDNYYIENKKSGAQDWSYSKANWDNNTQQFSVTEGSSGISTIPEGSYIHKPYEDKWNPISDYDKKGTAPSYVGSMEEGVYNPNAFSKRGLEAALNSSRKKVQVAEDAANANAEAIGGVVETP